MPVLILLSSLTGVAAPDLAASAGATEPGAAATAPPARQPKAAAKPAVVDPHDHDTGIRSRAVDPSAVVAVPARDPARGAALDWIEARLACACHEGGDLRIDRTRGTGAGACPCPFAAQVRTDLAQALAALDTAGLADKQAVAEHIEAGFVPLQPEYAGLFRFDVAAYDWFMTNVRCVCDGCKPTIFFSKCQLTCAPGIVYKTRVPIFLAMGFTKDEILDYYLAEFNASRPPREQVLRDWLLPGKQREQGWLVPALAISGVGGALFWALRRWTRRGRAGERRDVDAAAATPAAPVDPAAAARLRDAVDDDGDGW